MGDNTKIEWADKTFNPWIGCTKVSPGCDHCYAESWDIRFKRASWGAHSNRQRTRAANWDKVLKWQREAAMLGERRKVFCASLADVFDNHKSILPSWRADLWHLIYKTPNLDWLLLTKRPQNIQKMLAESYGAPAWGDGWPNVWIGTTVENQEEADRRIPLLLATPAAKRFVSAEPLLGPVRFTSISGTACLATPGSCCGGKTFVNALRGIQGCERAGAFAYPGKIGMPRGLDWIIVGGESGNGARPMHPDWARSIRDQCHAAGVPFFMKQMGGERKPFASIPNDLDIREFPNAG